MVGVVLRREKKLCVACMEEHEVLTIRLLEHTRFRGTSLTYKATYFYCDNDDMFYADEQMLQDNRAAMLKTYQKTIKERERSICKS